MAPRALRIHGDNIIECERCIDLLAEAFDAEVALAGDSIVTPSFTLQATNDFSVVLQCFPGFGRWKEDIIEGLRERGAVLREAPDVLVTDVTGDGENPLFALEFCSALDAGNQAWQRNGRAYSFIRARIPYFYVTEIGGFELSVDRKRRAARFPNPAVPFSYVASALRDVPYALPVFEPSLAAQVSPDVDFEAVHGMPLLLKVIKGIIDGRPDADAVSGLVDRAQTLAEVLARRRGRSDSLTAAGWAELSDSLRNGGSLVDTILASGCRSWTKTTYISALTASAKELMAHTSKLACGLTSSNMPFCIVPEGKRTAYADILTDLYGPLDRPFESWLTSRGPLVIAWIMGFKPRGDDARPDRGLPHWFGC